MSLDPLAKAITAIRREIRKIVGTVEPSDKHMILDLAEREIAKIREEVTPGK